jgi:hypothetical protein
VRGGRTEETFGELAGKAQKLTRIGAKGISHGRYAPSSWPRSRCRGRMFADILPLIAGFARQLHQHDERGLETERRTPQGPEYRSGAQGRSSSIGRQRTASR